MASMDASSAHAPAIPPSRGPQLIAISTSLFSLSTSIFGWRTYIRIRSRRLWWDDYFLIAAVSMGITMYGLVIYTYALGYGKSMMELATKPEKIADIFKFNFALQIILIWAVTSTKLSASLTLLRLRDNKYWRWFLYFLMAVLVGFAISNLAVELTQCRPLSTFWNPEQPGSACRPGTVNAQVAQFNSGFFIATDTLLSLMPLTFIYKIRRHWFEKVIVMVLMSLGLLASSVAIIRLVVLPKILKTKDPTRDTVTLALLGLGELYVGIFAVSSPALKSSFSTILKKLGVHGMTTKQTTGGRTAHLNTFQSDYTGPTAAGSEQSSPHREKFHSVGSAILHDEEAGLTNGQQNGTS
ncbi:hypothetical protein BT63DRAFT_211205 [Microthyrium microscopicum]|uniref:Rhodopsin domain-containing protein n=1 Tax=Microthyrium microscopicum TaxID=703497 RepID=A0A6A6UIF8_9PEZI|nr:hypothetical protein BT63DRAFT_211205 [Microthyrium microscopicum]